jgi:transcription elongation factor Elf1
MTKMVDYNINDVIILENIYFKLRAWDTQHPNINVYDRNMDVCPCCGSLNFESLDKKMYTNVSEFSTFRCSDCGKVFKNRKNNLEKRVKYITVT